MQRNRPIVYEGGDIPPCHICGATGDERVWKWTNAGRGGVGDLSMQTPLRVFSDTHTLHGSDVAALVCMQCGNVQLFVNPQDFQDIS